MNDSLYNHNESIYNKSNASQFNSYLMGTNKVNPIDKHKIDFVKTSIYKSDSNLNEYDFNNVSSIYGTNFTKSINMNEANEDNNNKYVDRNAMKLSKKKPAYDSYRSTFAYASNHQTQTEKRTLMSNISQINSKYLTKSDSTIILPFIESQVAFKPTRSSSQAELYIKNNIVNKFNNKSSLDIDINDRKKVKDFLVKNDTEVYQLMNEAINYKSFFQQLKELNVRHRRKSSFQMVKQSGNPPEKGVLKINHFLPYNHPQTQFNSRLAHFRGYAKDNKIMVEHYDNNNEYLEKEYEKLKNNKDYKQYNNLNNDYEEQL